MTLDPTSALRQWLAEQGNRPLGDAALASGRTLQPFSEGLSAAAGNLLRKAFDAVERNDDDRAARYVRRAAELPYDEHEQVHPAVMAAGMLLFREVTDAVDEADDGDVRWLTSAITVLDSAQGAGAQSLRHVLHTLDSDYVLPPRVAKPLRQAAGEGPAHQEPDPAPDAGADVVAETSASILRVSVAYHLALHH